MTTKNVQSERRPIASRDHALSRAFAHWLAAHHVSPNTISLAGMIAGLGTGMTFAATAFVSTPFLNRSLFVAAAMLIQLRLLANMFDGMVAIATGKASPVGELYNEVPDRVSDAAMFIGAGYGLGGHPALGYLAACMAVFLAYLRAQGKVAGAPQEFCGPMAKPQRAFIMTLLALYCGFAPEVWQINLLRSTGWGAIAWGLLLIIAGEVWTAGRRLRRIAHNLRET